MTPTETAKLVLVADDTDFFRNLLKDLVHRMGHRTLEARDGLEVLAALRAHTVDLVLLDLLLPEKSGFEILREVRQTTTRETLPVLAITEVFTSPEDIAHLRAIGANGFMNKSTPLEELVFRINHFLHAKGDFRGKPRVPVHMPVAYDDGVSGFTGYAFNLSETGMFLRTNNLLPIGTVITACLELPGDATVSLGGKVHWRREPSADGIMLFPPGMGLEFQNNPAASMDKLGRFVRRLVAETFLVHELEPGAGLPGV